MIYPAFAFKEKGGTIAIMCWDKDGGFGPIVVHGWEASGTVTGDLEPHQIILLFCSFADGTMPITAREHIERMVAGEDATKGVNNLFSAGYFISTSNLSKDGLLVPAHEELRSQQSAEQLMVFVANMFDDAWNRAMDSGLQWGDVEERLKCRFDDRSLSGFKQCRYEPTTL